MKNTLFVFTSCLLCLSTYGAESTEDAKATFQKARSTFESSPTTNPQVESFSPPSSRVRTHSIASTFAHLPIMGAISPRSTSQSILPRRGSVAISGEHLSSDSVPVTSSSPTEHSGTRITTGNTKSLREMLKGDIKLRAPGQFSTGSSSPRYSSSPETKEVTFLSPTQELSQGDHTRVLRQQAIKSDVEMSEETQPVPVEDIASHIPGMPQWGDLIDLTRPGGLNLENVKQRYDLFVPLKLNADITYDCRYDVTLDIFNLQSFKYRVFQRSYQQDLIIPAVDNGLKKAKSLKDDRKKKRSSHKKVEKDLKILIEKLARELPAEQSKLDSIYSEEYINTAIDGATKRILGVLGSFGLTAMHLEALEAEEPINNDEKANESSDEEGATSDVDMESLAIMDEGQEKAGSAQISASGSPTLPQSAEILDASFSAPSLHLSGSPTVSDTEDDAPTPRQFPKFDLKRVGFTIDELRKRTQKKHKREITKKEAEEVIRTTFRYLPEDIIALVDNYALSQEGFRFYEVESEDLKRKDKD